MDCHDRIGNGVYEELKDFDMNKDDQDEWETPIRVFQYLCAFHMVKPKLDVCADSINRKCELFWNKEFNALLQEWDRDIWCNPPHSLTEEFVKKADASWQKNNINILMIVPANAIGAHYFDYVFDNHHAKYYRYSGRIKFTQHGIEKSSSRNGYFSVVWRKVNVGLEPW